MANKLDSIGRAVARFFHFSPDLLIPGMTVTIYAGKQAVIEGYRTILEYDDNLLRVSDGKRRVCVYGSHLMLCEMSDEGLTVEGEIHCAEYEYGRETAT